MAWTPTPETRLHDARVALAIAREVAGFMRERYETAPAPERGQRRGPYLRALANLVSVEREVAARARETALGPTGRQGHGKAL